MSLASGYNDEQIAHVSLALVPIRLGDPDESGRVVVYTGQHVPAGFRLDTLAVDDGTYDLRFAIETHDGAVSVSEQRDRAELGGAARSLRYPRRPRLVRPYRPEADGV